MISPQKIAIFILAALVFFASAECDARARKAKAQEDVKRPPSAEVSQSVIDALAKADLNGAILALREEKTTPKLLYLMREVAKTAGFETQKKPDKTDAHEVYQNLAISYHNIYLFLKSKGVDQEKYFEEASRYYKKARRAGTKLHKAECDVLDAALIAAGGDGEKARKQFSKVNLSMLRGDFESAEYLAAYYAAVGDVDEATASLEKAYKLNPGALLTWLAVGDDFHKIEEDPKFQGLMTSLKVREAEKKLTLTVPKGEKPRLGVSDESGLFRPQKSMPHYKLKKKSTASKKAATGAKKKHAVKKAATSNTKSTGKTKK